MAKRPTKSDLLARYAELVSTDPSAAYRFGVESNLRAKDMAAASERAKILAATEFHVAIYVGRDPRDDHGVVRERLYKVLEGFSTLEAARAASAAQGTDAYGRRPIVRAIIGGCPIGVVVPEDFGP